MFEPCQKQDKCDSLLSGKCPFSARYPDPTTAPSSALGDVAEQAKRASRFLRQIDPPATRRAPTTKLGRVATAPPPSRIQAAVLEPVKKLQSAALLLDFWLGPRREGGGNTRRGVADALHRPAGCLCRLCPARATQVKPKRDAMLWARARKAVWLRCPLGYSPLRGCPLACALPGGLSCSRAALANFFTGS